MNTNGVSKKAIILSLLFFFAVYLITRVPRLGSTVLNIDEVYWHDRAEKFINALGSGNYAKTYLIYHPGVPIMWELAGTAKFISASSNASLSQAFSNHEKLHATTLVFLVSWFFVLFISLIFLLNKIYNKWWLAFLSVLVLSVEPFYLANTRLIHHDAQISLCVILALVLIYLYTVNKVRLLNLILAGFFLAVAALSKTLFFGAFIYTLFSGALLIYFKQGIKKTLIYLITLAFSFVAFYFMLFPAMWVQPKETIDKIMTQSYEVGAEAGQRQTYFGKETRDPGVTFYPVLLLIRTSPFLFAGFLIFLGLSFLYVVKVISEKKRFDIKNVPFLLFITIFYLGYFCVITYFTKKIDRYIVVLYPYIVIVSVWAWYKIATKTPIKILATVIFLVSVIPPLISIFPHYYTYVSPFVGGAKNAEKMIHQMLFGTGVFDLRDRIVEKYGDSESIGMNNHKPFVLIYPKGKVYDVLSEHPNSFRIMVLGLNKEMPESIQKDPSIKYKYIESIVINELEFFRIYERR